MSQYNLNFLFKFISAFGAAIFIFAAAFAYIQSEVQTFLHISDIDSKKLCTVDTKSSLKYSKIVDYQRYRKSSEIFCIFADSKENSKLGLSLINNDWQIISKQKLNREGAFYWPIYL